MPFVVINQGVTVDGATIQIKSQLAVGDCQFPERSRSRLPPGNDCALIVGGFDPGGNFAGIDSGYAVVAVDFDVVVEAVEEQSGAGVAGLPLGVVGGEVVESAVFVTEGVVGGKAGAFVEIPLDDGGGRAEGVGVGVEAGEFAAVIGINDVKGRVFGGCVDQAVTADSEGEATDLAEAGGPFESAVGIDGAEVGVGEADVDGTVGPLGQFGYVVDIRINSLVVNAEVVEITAIFRFENAVAIACANQYHRRIWCVDDIRFEIVVIVSFIMAVIQCAIDINLDVRNIRSVMAVEHHHYVVPFKVRNIRHATG